ncbi:deoxynucleoside kinase [Thiobacter aerophilum]|uniref:Deoxynucleoside kinase n=1 Tax=Thiobacter aerophilum TaxID=3121275 RepID=A0ABV0EI08_9BURK
MAGLLEIGYIVVEGPIGAGKTSLARRLAERLDATLLLEGAEANPFLPRYYQDPPRFALATQLFFLFQRVEQVRQLTQRELFARPVVADFVLDKDPLFARLTLSDDEFRLYQQVYAELAPQAPSPDLVIYLQAPVDVLLERVRSRGIEYERAIDRDYLTRLSEAYAQYFYHYEASPLMIVNSAHLNFVAEPADLDLLLARLPKVRGRAFLNRGD